MTTDELLASPEDRNFVVALARGLEVLRSFRPNEVWLTNQDFSERTGLPKPTISRLTFTLCRLGYLVQTEGGVGYRLGPAVLSLGFSVLSGIEVAERAGEELRALASGPSPYLSASLAEREQFMVVCLAIQRSRHPISISMGVGSRVPLFHSAAGRAILLGMNEDKQDTLVRQAEQAMPNETGTMRRSLERARDDFSRHGFCTSFGELVPELNAISVPVASPDGDRLFALTVGGPSFLLPSEMLLEEYGQRLRAAGRQLSGHPVEGHA